MGRPSDLKYAETHEWLRAGSGDAEIGITDYAVEQLSDVQYEMQANQNRFEIRGRWRLNNASGFFRFRVPMDDLFVFSGFSSQNRNAGDGGIWDGVRIK